MPTLLLFDSGVGGLTIHSEVARARPDARIVYLADNAAFPYGKLGEEELRQRVLVVLEKAIGRFAPDAVIIACNTASTAVLPALRARFPMPFIGTVPAVKPAAQASESRIIAILATPGTVARDYTHQLIADHARDCEVLLVGSTKLAQIAEAHLRGETVCNEEIVREIAPCFIERIRKDGTIARTDTVALSCTHYPLLLDLLQRLAPWPVRFISVAPAIASRVVQLIGPAETNAKKETAHLAVFSSGAALPASLKQALAKRGLCEVETGFLAFG